LNDRIARAALNRHWDASDGNDFDAEHEIYHEMALLDDPQSGERIGGRRNIQESRHVHPNKKAFTVSRIVGGGDLCVSEIVATYDDKPSYLVSIMEFENELVVREIQYFGNPFNPGATRSHLIEHRAWDAQNSCLATPRLRFRNSRSCARQRLRF
jgi:hypothetical protein